MNAFITGSRAYGQPRADSDIDLVIRCDENTAQLLRQVCDNPDIEGSAGEACNSIRFGKLNLLLCTNDRRFADFVVGTSELQDAAFRAEHITRQDAVQTFTVLRSGLFRHISDNPEPDA